MLHGGTLPNPPAKATIESFAKGLSQVASVADAAARNALVAGISGITAANPVWVYRQDTGDVEITRDGTTWTSISTGPASSTPITSYGTGWQAATGTPTVYREGGWAWINGIVRWASGTATTVLTLPVGYRPKYTVNIPLTAENSGGVDGPQCWGDISTAGVLTVHQMTGAATWTATTWMVIHPTPYRHA